MMNRQDAKIAKRTPRSILLLGVLGALAVQSYGCFSGDLVLYKSTTTKEKIDPEQQTRIAMKDLMSYSAASQPAVDDSKTTADLLEEMIP